MESVRFHVHPLLDASLFKSFQLHENYTFEIRGEVYNVANTPNFWNPSTSIGGTSFGSVAPHRQTIRESFSSPGALTSSASA